MEARVPMHHAPIAAAAPMQLRSCKAVALASCGICITCCQRSSPQHAYAADMLEKAEVRRRSIEDELRDPKNFVEWVSHAGWLPGWLPDCGCRLARCCTAYHCMVKCNLTEHTAGVVEHPPSAMHQPQKLAAAEPACLVMMQAAHAVMQSRWQQHTISTCTASAPCPPPRYLLPRPLRILFFGGSAASCLIAALLSAVRLVKVGAAACYLLWARWLRIHVPRAMVWARCCGRDASC